MIRFDEVGKRYGRVWSLHPVSGVVRKGSVVALCGSNGAGKSTLLNVLNGTTRASCGSVSIEGEAANAKHVRSRLGYMPDDFEFDAAMTVKETLRYYGLLQGVKKIPGGLLERVGLAEHADKRTRALSKGMRQRLLLAQALLNEPSLLVLDEPTNGLDPHWIRELTTILTEERERGTTVIFSTHQLDVAAEMADEVWVLQEGRIVQRITGNDEAERYREIRAVFG